ncbi:MAG: hypothetical protein BWY50_01539 [Spirochaetes bacterium ADurb.Bin315]|nr:MAG: hypothetical protein BWY50_01539 [Spirochaetes bacterium ADurb.Bin315]HOE88624.1 hypothetical protein [Sphaerochaeta sp.]HOR79354.1 hypothetical protein [Sphaerochaeta sp.]HPK63637.1 hypothetical protein [Sphaerochaeta sp.]
MEKSFDYEQYDDSIHRLGRITNAIGILSLLATPFLFALVLGASLSWSGFAKGLLRVAITYLPITIVEFLIYVPILGPGGSYLSFITGNIINMKLPCAYNAREIAKTQAGTPEDSIITTLAVGVSSLVTMLVIFIGVLLLIPLTPVLNNPTLRPAFDNLLPALFGALGAQYFFKSWKVSAIPLILMIALSIAIPALIAQTTIMMILIGAIAIAITYFFHKKGALQ